MPRGRPRKNATGAGAPAAPRARANNQPQVPFAYKLVLNQWLLSLFNVNLTQLPTELLLEYDQNIVKHTQRLNERGITHGEEPIVWKYFVKHIAAPQIFSAAFERDSEKRLRLSSKSGGRLKQDAPSANEKAPYWFRTVTGTTPDGRKALIIWRKLTGEPEQNNLVLDEWFTKEGYSAKDSEFDLIYVNGGNNLENPKTPDDLWKVRLIEEDFHRLMFEAEGV